MSMKRVSVTIQMKAAEQYFPLVLFMMLYKVALFRLSLEVFRATLISFLLFSVCYKFCTHSFRVLLLSMSNLASCRFHVFSL